GTGARATGTLRHDLDFFAGAAGPANPPHRYDHRSAHGLHGQYDCSTGPDPNSRCHTMTETPRKRILSGMQPSGLLHLGNWLGALENWKALQADHDCFFFVAHRHALS